MAALLLSDLHLPATSSPLREAFRQLLAGPARQASAVYLLGDLFEYWVGDDAGCRDYEDEVAALSSLRSAGVPVYFLHGNRDFLVGRHFARASGVTLLDDPVCVELGGVPTLLSHGDQWCLDDLGYQRFRRFAHNPLAQFVFLNLPLSLRQRIAGSLRRESGAHKRQKASEIMDVRSSAVRQAFHDAGVRRIIHGHTHRPAFHHGPEGERIVLPDWREGRCDVLWVLDEGRCQLQRAQAPAPSGR
jgi:UDP-2,3-diacylglucosamine hydrolase